MPHWISETALGPGEPFLIELVEQSLCLLEVRSIEAFSEPAQNRRKQTLGLIASPLSLQDSAEAHRRT